MYKNDINLNSFPGIQEIENVLGNKKQKNPCN